jgi:hypothetical protein
MLGLWDEEGDGERASEGCVAGCCWPGCQALFVLWKARGNKAGLHMVCFVSAWGQGMGEAARGVLLGAAGRVAKRYMSYGRRGATRLGCNGVFCVCLGQGMGGPARGVLLRAAGRVAKRCLSHGNMPCCTESTGGKKRSGSVWQHSRVTGAVIGSNSRGLQLNSGGFLLS